jgi:hypothetical protein
MRGGVINRRAWTKITQTRAPSLTVPPSGASVSVLTTAAATVPSLTVHSAPLASHATVAAEARTGPLVHNISSGSLATAASHPLSATQHSAPVVSLVTVAAHPLSSTTRDLTFAVITTVGANTAIGLGWVPLVDENGNPILDENDDPIYVLGQGSDKNAVAAPVVDVAASTQSGVGHDVSLAALTTAAASTIGTTVLIVATYSDPSTITVTRVAVGAIQ